MIKKIKATVAAGSALAVSALPAFAAIENPVGAFSTVEGAFNVIFNAIIGIAGAIALILLAIGGIQYMTSGGDKTAVENARGRITAAIVGLIVVFGAWLVINIIGQLLGVDTILTPSVK